MRILKYSLYLFVLAIFVSSCQKIDQKKLIGTWEVVGAQIGNLDQYLDQFKEKYQANNEEIEREKSRVEALPEAYYPTGITMSFKKDGKYELGGIPGKWTFDTKTKELIISLTSFDKNKFVIKKLTRDKLVLIYPFDMTGVNLQAELTLKRVNSED